MWEIKFPLINHGWEYFCYILHALNYSLKIS